MRLSRLFGFARRGSARYYSATPLFDFSLAELAVADGWYDSANGDSAIEFRASATGYAVGGSAKPGTVTLIPIAGRPGDFVFQQSNGPGIAFYGVIQTIKGTGDFSLFSPESVKEEAINAARRAGAVVSRLGCAFGSGNALLSALIPLAYAASPECWDVYAER